MRANFFNLLSCTCLLLCLAASNGMQASVGPTQTTALHPVLQQAAELRYKDPQAAVDGLISALEQPHSSALQLEIADLAARIAREQGWLEQAMDYSDRMIQLAEQLNKPVLQGRALHMQGTILAEQGDISAAIKNFHEARRVLENTPDIGSLALAVNALGVAHFLLEDSERALKYYEQALPLAREADNQVLELSILGNLALIAAELEGPNESIQLHKQALALAREIEHVPQIGNQLANLCKQYTLSYQFEAAETACSDALPIAESLGHPKLLAGTLMTLGDLHVEKNLPEQALAFYQRSLGQVTESLPFVEIELLEKMISLNEQRGGFEQALNHIRRLGHLREEILDKERNEAIEELEVQYQVEQQAREMEMLRLETELQAAELRKRESMLLASALALILVLLSSLITWRSYRTKSMLQHDLAVRNKELNLAIEQVSHLANRDTLTGLLNRRAFKQAADEQNARRLRKQTPLTLVMADIDKFKLINDVHGHPVGDQVLKIIAYRIRQNLREVDFASRWGGEEFLLMLPDTNVAEARTMILRLRDELAEHPVETLAGDLPITLTFGIAEVNSSIKDAIHAADQAMYTGKRTGPNRVVVSNLISLVSNNAS